MDQNIEDLQSPVASNSDTRCTTSNTRSVAAVTNHSNVVTSDCNIPPSLVIANRPVIILGDSMLARFMAQDSRSLSSNLCSPVSLLSLPPEISLVSDRITNTSAPFLPLPNSNMASLTAPPCSEQKGNARNILSDSDSPLEEDTSLNVIQESPEVSVIPDSPQKAITSNVDGDPPLSLTQAKELSQVELPHKMGYGENILNTWTTSILSLSKQQTTFQDDTTSSLNNLEPTENPASGCTKPQHDMFSQLIPKALHPLPKIQPSPYVSLAEEKEQLFEDSDNELEIPALDDDTYNAQDSMPDSTNSTQGSKSGMQEQTSPTQKLCTDTDDSCPNPALDSSLSSKECIPVTDQQLHGVECEEPLAKKPKMEMAGSSERRLDASSSRSQLDKDLHDKQSLPLVSTSLHENLSVLETDIIDEKPASLKTRPSIPQEPVDCADDGFDTIEQALPTECAREHALVPNLPRCAQQAEQSDSSDSDDEGDAGQATVISANLPKQAHVFREDTDSVDYHQTELSRSEHQIVPDELSLDSSFSSKSFYSDEQKEKTQGENEQGLMNAIEDIDIESMNDTTVLSLRLESQKNKTTQTAHQSRLFDHYDEDGASIMHCGNVRVPYTQQNCFTFKSSKSVVSELCPTTRLNLGKPRLRLGLSRKVKQSPVLEHK